MQKFVNFCQKNPNCNVREVHRPPPTLEPFYPLPGRPFVPKNDFDFLPKKIFIRRSGLDAFVFVFVANAGAAVGNERRRGRTRRTIAIANLPKRRDVRAKIRRRISAFSFVVRRSRLAFADCDKFVPALIFFYFGVWNRRIFFSYFGVWNRKIFEEKIFEENFCRCRKNLCFAIISNKLNNRIFISTIPYLNFPKYSRSGLATAWLKFLGKMQKKISFLENAKKFFQTAIADFKIP